MKEVKGRNLHLTLTTSSSLLFFARDFHLSKTQSRFFFLQWLLLLVLRSCLVCGWTNGLPETWTKFRAKIWDSLGLLVQPLARQEVKLRKKAKSFFTSFQFSNMPLLTRNILQIIELFFVTSVFYVVLNNSK